MTLRFHKLHGLGNDFMLVDARQQPWNPGPQIIAALADRHEGVGFDQLLILDPPLGGKADVACRIYNLDGSAAGQCLNGMRCIARYLAAHEPERETWLIAAPAGLLVAARVDAQVARNMVELSIPSPKLIEPKARDIEVLGRNFAVWLVDAGNLHAVSFGPEPRTARARFGRALSTHPAFTSGANAEFAHVSAAGEIELAVFERGSGPTRACGSGAAAAALVARVQTAHLGPWTVRQPGGALVVDWSADGRTLIERGPAEYVFQGELK